MCLSDTYTEIDGWKRDDVNEDDNLFINRNIAKKGYQYLWERRINKEIMVQKYAINVLLMKKEWSQIFRNEKCYLRDFAILKQNKNEYLVQLLIS